MASMTLSLPKTMTTTTTTTTTKMMVTPPMASTPWL